MYRGKNRDPHYFAWLVAYEAGEAKGFEKTCVSCQERFPARTQRARFCSRRCYQWATRAWVCPIDDTLFHQPSPPSGSFKKYCSQRCKKAAANLRGRGVGHDPQPKRFRPQRCRRYSALESPYAASRPETAPTPKGRVRRVISF